MALFALSGSPYDNNAQMIGQVLEVEQLFGQLKLDLAGLAQVRQELDQARPDRAADLLLAYYRAKYANWPEPVNPTASAADYKIAQDAKNHIFHILAGSANYPPHDYGPDIDWDANPVDDIEWPAGMHRFAYWDGPITNCYLATGDDRYARIWLELVADWIRKNPLTLDRLPFPQSWDAIQVGIRCQRMAALLPIYIKSPCFTTDFLLLFLTSVYNHARRIVQMPYLKYGNFGIIETIGLAQITKEFPEFTDQPLWQEHVTRRMAEMMAEQVLDDGVQGELCPNYHVLVTNLYLDYLELARIDDLPARLLTMINRMVEHCLAIMLPDSTMFWVGDTSSSSSLRPLLEKAGRLLQRPDFLAVASQGVSGSWPQKLNFCFPEGGFYTFRNSWQPDAIWLGLHCGGATIQGPDSFHSQFDRGTFELAAYGRKLMTDPGVYSYRKGDPGREAMRASRVHQTLTLNSKNTKKAGSMVEYSQSEATDTVFVTVENQAYPDLVHRRTVFFVQKRFFLILDQASGTATGQFDLHFQLTPGPYQLDPVQKRACTAFPEGGNVLVATLSNAPVQLLEETAWFSARWHEKVKLPAFCFRHDSSTAPLYFLTLLYPFSGPQAPQLEFYGADDAGCQAAVLSLDGQKILLPEQLSRGLT